MRRLLTTAACCGVLFAGSTVGAQDIVGNSLSRAGDAVSNTAGQARGVAQNLGSAVRNQVGHTVSGANATIHRVGDAVFPHAAPHAQYPAHSQHRVGVHANVQTPQGYGHQVHGMHSYSQQRHARHGYGNHGYGYNTTAVPTNVVYTLRHDSSGREFICVNGQPVYFDSVTSQSNAHQDGTQPDDRYQAGYGSYESTADPQSLDDQSEHLEAPTTDRAPQQSAEQAPLEQTESNRAVDNAEEAVEGQEAAADAENQDSDNALDSSPL